MPQLHYRNGEGWINGVDIFYPVGAIYMATNETSPAEMFGGTWSALIDGRFLRPNGTWSFTGGATNHFHWTTQGYTYPETESYSGDYHNLDDAQPSRTKTGKHLPIRTTGAPFNGMYRENGTYLASSLPPYRTCYVWYRTA